MLAIPITASPGATIKREHREQAADQRVAQQVPPELLEPPLATAALHTDGEALVPGAWRGVRFPLVEMRRCGAGGRAPDGSISGIRSHWSSFGLPTGRVVAQGIFASMG